MAERRMFAKTIIDSDLFLDMSQSAQLLSSIRLLGITPKACYTLARIGSRSRRTFKVHSA